MKQQRNMTKAEMERDIKRLHVIMLYSDVRKGCPESAGACPVARAIRRAVERRVHPSILVSVKVSDSHVSIFPNSFRLPKKIGKFIFDFDSLPPNAGREDIQKAIDSPMPDTDTYCSFYLDT